MLPHVSGCPSLSGLSTVVTGAPVAACSHESAVRHRCPRTPASRSSGDGPEVGLRGPAVGGTGRSPVAGTEAGALTPRASAAGPPLPRLLPGSEEKGFKTRSSSQWRTVSKSQHRGHCRVRVSERPRSWGCSLRNVQNSGAEASLETNTRRGAPCTGRSGLGLDEQASRSGAAGGDGGLVCLRWGHWHEPRRAPGAFDGAAGG